MINVFEHREIATYFVENKTSYVYIVQQIVILMMLDYGILFFFLQLDNLEYFLKILLSNAMH